jgi:membrane protease YdiL (CAAX protease family)
MNGFSPSSSTLPPTRIALRIPRTLQFALFLVGCLWMIASYAAADYLAQAVVNRLNLPILDALLKQVFALLLMAAGFAMLSWTATRPVAADAGAVRRINALPTRATSRQEWVRGGALGWAMLLLAALPMMLAGDLHPGFWWQPAAWGQTLLSLATLAVGALALEVAFRGYVYSRLIAAVNPVAATIVLSLIYAIGSSYRDHATGFSIVVTFCMGVLFSLAYLRTHALWLGWGMHFAWNAAMVVLFGLPLAGYVNGSNVVGTNVSGAAWFTGGAYGPEGSVLAFIVVLAAIPMLYRITRSYAWEYTHEPIVAAGYEVVIAPPAAHTAMEAAAPPAPLVQILGATPTNSSTMPVIEEHLRNSTTTDSTQ